MVINILLMSFIGVSIIVIIFVGVFFLFFILLGYVKFYNILVVKVFSREMSFLLFFGIMIFFVFVVFELVELS